MHHTLLTRIVRFVDDTSRRRPRDEAGMTTAELLANAALGVGALVLVWGLMRVIGVDMLSWMRTQIGIG